MNLFKEYATSSAFRIDLSGPQVAALLHIAYGYEDKASNFTLAPYHALARRGLITWHSCEDSEDAGPYVTSAGSLVARLLLLAGYGRED